MPKKYKAHIPDQNYWAEQIKCQTACPVNTDVRGYIRAITKGDYEKAYLIARISNPLASICGYVCRAPCEAACRRGEIDDPLRIRALKRFVAEKFKAKTSQARVDKIAQWLFDRLEGAILDNRKKNGGTVFDPHTSRNYLKAEGQKIAIIGAGPAGLAAAHDLALMGFSPTIFEMEPVPAGMLYLGVPEFRLPHDIILAEVKFIENLGVEIQCNMEVGKDISFSRLRNDFDAVIIAIGVKKSDSIPILGIEADQVFGGIEFLRDSALGKHVDIGPRVVILGGGNVACDIGRSAIRQTSQDADAYDQHNNEVHICCLEKRNEMPADEIEIIQGLEEGITLHNSISPKEILTQNDKLLGVRFVHCKQVWDEKGRFNPILDESRQQTIHCDSVIMAVGQQCDLVFINDENNDIALLKNGLLKLNPDTLQTTAKNVFAAGDLAYGSGFLIDAVASGKKTARAIYTLFTGRNITPRITSLHIPIKDYFREFGYEARQQTEIGVLPVAQRGKNPIAQVELTLPETDSCYEAERCLHCEVNTIFDSNTCLLCSGCVDICPYACLKIVGIEQLEADSDIYQLHDVLYQKEEVSVIIKDDTTCIRCGLCAERCPVGAITMEQYRVGEL